MFAVDPIEKALKKSATKTGEIKLARIMPPFELRPVGVGAVTTQQQNFCSCLGTAHLDLPVIICALSSAHRGWTGFISINFRTRRAAARECLRLFCVGCIRPLRRWAMLLIGFAGFGFVAYRRQRKKGTFAGTMSNAYRILVAIDLKPGTDRLLAEAQRYAKAFDAIVNIVHVADPDPDFVGYIKGAHGVTDYDQILRDNRAKEFRLEHRQAHAFAERMRATGIRVDQALTVQGPTLETILEEARKFGAI
jgi:nucleotide-binding universal stress UspA family protein